MGRREEMAVREEGVVNVYCVRGGGWLQFLVVVMVLEEAVVVTVSG